MTGAQGPRTMAVRVPSHGVSRRATRDRDVEHHDGEVEGSEDSEQRDGAPTHHAPDPRGCDPQNGAAAA